MSSRRLRVTFFGFGRFWIPVLLNGLQSRFSDELDLRWMEWPSSWSERARFLAELFRCDVAVRVGMPLEFDSETSRVFLSMVTRLRRPKVVNYWIGGGDLPVFAERLSSGKLSERDQAAIARMTHFGATENIADELRELGVPARAVVFPTPERPLPPQAPALPDEFRVLTYWTDRRAEVCGAPTVIEAAGRLPHIPFDVVGTDGATLEAPENMHFRGYIEDVGPYHLMSVASIRLVSHDAMPGSMSVESLAHARHVVYSYEYPHTIHVAFGDVDGLVREISALKERHSRGELHPNSEGREYVLQQFDPDVLFPRLKDALIEVARGA